MSTAISGASNADVYASLGLTRNATATGSTGLMDETQNRFLKLLVTQVRNQDPLNPMDQAEMTSQIAQINTVNGIEKLNATMSGLVDSYQSSEAMQAASMIGKRAMVAGEKLELTSGGAVAAFELAGPADSLTVTIKDGAGLTLRTLTMNDLSAGPGNFYWDGKTDGGATAQTGAYRFEIAAKRGENNVTAKPMVIGTVNAVTHGKTGYELDLGALGSFAFADVRQIL